MADEVAPLHRLDPHDIGAEQGKLIGCKGARKDMGYIQNPDSFERSGHIGLSSRTKIA